MKKSNFAARASLLFAPFLIVTSFCYGQSLEKASELADSGNAAEAALEYFAWLEENPDNPDFVKVAIRAAGLETEAIIRAALQGAAKA